MNKKWLLREAPKDRLTADIFEFTESGIPHAGENEVVVQVRYISVWPAYRLYMDSAKRDYQPEIGPGDVMFGYGIGEVLSSRSPLFEVGDIAEGPLGWQQYAAMPADQVVKRNPGHALHHLHGALGIVGMTAYDGICDSGRVRSGETVLISSAAGGVGSIAAQLAKIRGARVIGIAGGPDKCRWLVDDLGLDGAIDYKRGALGDQLRDLAPQGVDLYFDNVGGKMLAEIIPQMARAGRVIISGFLGSYDDRGVDFDLTEFWIGVITRQLRLIGLYAPAFLASEAAVQAEREMSAWLADGRLKAPVEMREGLETLPAALISLFEGVEKRGAMMVRV